MEDSVKFYCNENPKIGEIVQVVFTSRHDDCASGSMTEYNRDVIMSFSQATKKKKIRSINKIIPLEQQLSAVVEDYDEKSQTATVSRAYIVDLDDGSSTKFLNNHKIYNGIYQICIQHKINFNELWINKISPYIKELVSSTDDDTINVLDLFINNINKLDTLLEDSTILDEIKNRLSKVIVSNTIYKKQIGIISNNGIVFTKQLIQESIDDESMKEFKDQISIKYFNTPNYIVETKLSEDLLNEFIELVIHNSKKMNNVFVKI
jgi:translation initiation factor 2 alpha subunit (eIF-2alpha)|uniref:S1 motif domain-containing protein n=1 Tax=viral metagenome TaxID=1070528 RepID=A0A6C0IW10_9ZZZZ